MSQRLVIGIVGAVVILLVFGGFVLLNRQSILNDFREGGIPVALRDECMPTYQVPSPDEGAQGKISGDFDLTVAVDPNAELRIREPFALWYSLKPRVDIPYAVGELQTFGSVSLFSTLPAEHRLASVPVFGGWQNLRAGEERSSLLTAKTLQIDSVGEGQISFILYTSPDELEANIDNIPHEGVRKDVYFLTTPEGIFTNSYSPLMLRVEHLNKKCDMQDITQQEYESELDTMLGEGAIETSEIRQPEQEPAEEWAWVRDKPPTDFFFPASWTLVSDSPYEQLVHPERTMFITLKHIVFNAIGPTYCGGNYSEPSRCEAMKTDGVLGFIDWGIAPGEATALFGVTDEIGVRASLAVAGQLRENDKIFFRDFLSRFRFTRTSSGILDHYVRIIKPNGITNLCSGEQTIVEWDHKGVETVQLWIRKAGGSSYEIGKFPADFNDEGVIGKGTYPWQVGQTSGFMFNLDQFGKPVSGTEGLNDLNVFIFGKSAGTVTPPRRIWL